MEQISDVLEKIAAAPSCEALWEVMLDYLHAQGISMVSYHAVRPDGAPLGIATDGFPEDWVCTYIDKDLVRVDPIPELAARMATPFYWHDIENLIDLTEGNKRYLDAMNDAHLGDGLALYVFGPALQNAYVGLGFGVERVELPNTTVFEIQCVVQAGHLRFCALNSSTRQETSLSAREREVLEWVAQGKSNSVIAQIAGISVHTVDAHMRSIYRKLGVNDRTSAAVRGLGRGLVLPAA